jgi:5-methylcytosine-specific restriction endonuclease McrA
MKKLLRNQVRLRARDRCEYCLMPQSGTVLPHEVDHIRSQKHGGHSTLSNLCWACASCNAFKGTDIAACPPDSDQIVPLFNPRADSWDDHFLWEGAFLRGRTPVAAATIEMLRINQPDRVDHRRLLMQLGLWK